VPNKYRFGRFELRPGERALLAEGKALRLGGRAFDILLALVERRDRVVEFDELLDVVWPGLAVEENNLSVQISSLRKLVGTDAITTVRGKGYRFTALIRELAADDKPQGVAPRACTPLRPWGAALVFRANGEWNGEWPGFVSDRATLRFADGLGLVFDRAADAARAALKALRQQPGRFAIAAIDGAGGTESAADAAAAAAAAVAHELAGFAAPHELIATSELVAEFVADVDGEVEDLGDLSLASGMVRAYCIRPAAGHAAPAPLAALDCGDFRPGIAILPFEGLAGADPDDLLGEALADDVITCLARHSAFTVVSGLSSRRLKRCGLPVEAMAGCLFAPYILTGSYLSASGRLHLHAHLQDARHGAVLRSIELEAGLGDAFDPAEPLGHRIATEVAEVVFSHSVQQSKLRPLPELESYALLLGAISLMHRAALREFERARAMLEHLERRHGCRGVASAWLAKWHVLRVVQGWSLDASTDARIALEYVQRSLNEDSRDALALAIGGLVHAYLRKDLRMAGQLYEEAIDANPSEPLAWLFTATRCAYLGQGREAEAAGERALRLSPIDPLKYFFDSLAATATLSNSNWERAVALSLRSLKANRTHASTWRTLAFALVMLDRMDEARAAVQRLLAIEPGFTVSRFLERFPGRDGPLAQPWAEALKAADLPN
jgi:DNA-binding winged helix-turn-helix (wHTH) protein/TolB-like protein